MVKTETDISLVKIFRSWLKNGGKYTNDIYHHLFSAISDEDLENHLQSTFEIYNGKSKFYHKKDWFYCFHKFLRQGDFFVGCGRTYPAPTISKKEEKELNSLNKKISKFIDGIPLEKQDTNAYTNLQTKHPEIFRRRNELGRKKHRTESTSISGHLDMILWHMIHLDEEDILKGVFEHTFVEYKNKSK